MKRTCACDQGEVKSEEARPERPTWLSAGSSRQKPRRPTLQMCRSLCGGQSPRPDNLDYPKLQQLYPAAWDFSSTLCHQHLIRPHTQKKRARRCVGSSTSPPNFTHTRGAPLARATVSQASCPKRQGAISSDIQENPDRPAPRPQASQGRAEMATAAVMDPGIIVHVLIR
jgi:hypothetical protein